MSDDPQTGDAAAISTSTLAEQRQLRHAKVAALRNVGVDPYPDRFERSATALQLHDRHGDLTPGSETGEQATVAGRVMLLRRMGKLQFLTIRDGEGALQLFVSKAVIGEAGFDEVADLDLGDWVGASGEVIVTRTGELSIRAERVTLLAKALRPLPDKFRGLTDTDMRFRQRYVDLMVNEEARRIFRVRHEAVRALRRELEDDGFVEVETPILQIEAGGAAARPFVTHHNSLDQEMYLRIATELHLKRLVVGGMERVFEIGRIFRNEGIDTRHNPEFTSVEVYQALTNYDGMMALTERLVCASALAACGSLVIPDGAGTIDLTPPWPRRRLSELIAEHVGLDLTVHSGLEQLRAACDQVGVGYEATWGPGRLLYAIFDKKVEHLLGHGRPMFAYEYPTEVSPLAKPNPHDDAVVDRFELFVSGRELANGYSELNDPVRQRAMFEAEVSLAAAGDEEAQRTVDEDYLRALEYGLPPTGGLGIGIDRLVMLLAGVASIREVILFPTLRPEQ